MCFGNLFEYWEGCQITCGHYKVLDTIYVPYIKSKLLRVNCLRFNFVFRPKGHGKRCSIIDINHCRFDLKLKYGHIKVSSTRNGDTVLTYCQDTQVKITFVLFCFSLIWYSTGNRSLRENTSWVLNL